MGSTAENSKKLPRGASFPVGKSGNPGGRPKRTEEELNLIEACKGKTMDALKVIDTLMRSADKDSVKLSAAQYIIDRGWGRPVQQTDMIVSGDPENPFTIRNIVIEGVSHRV